MTLRLTQQDFSWADFTKRLYLTHSEIRKKTVIQHFPQSRQADEYRALAEKIEQNDMFVIPKPMTQERLEEILFEYGLMENIEDDYRI